MSTLNICMPKFLYSVLTSSDLNHCRRAVSTIPDGRNIVVVVNTQEPDYLDKVVNSDLRNRVTIVNTESNGTPGQGKQSVADYFMKTDCDYLIPIDGDDFWCEHGCEKLENYITQKQPDVVGLLNEDIFIDEKVYSSWRDLKLVDILDPLQLDDMNVVRDYFMDVTSLIRHNGCVFNRLVAFSKKACSLTLWDTELPGSEDALLSAQLKLLHLSNQLAFHLIESSDIYMYIKQTFNGTGFKLFTSDVAWCRKHFFGHFSANEIDLLKSQDLPCEVWPPAKKRFQRIKYAKKVIKAFS